MNNLFDQKIKNRYGINITLICWWTLGEGEKGVGAGVPGTEPLAIPTEKYDMIII